MSKDVSRDGNDTAPVIVAVAASAAVSGFLEALLARLPPHADPAVIVVLQHMEAFDEGRFRQAARAGGHEPAWIADSLPVEAGRLYLTPPDVVVTMDGGRFVAESTEQAPGLQGVIDSFLVSLAHDRGERAIGVVLKGTDGDGTLGARELKEAGGVVLAESVPEDPAHSESAAALADAVLPVEGIAARLSPLIGQAARHQGDDAPDIGNPRMREALGAIAALLRQKTGHDLHGYKPGTFLRRVQRRLQALLLDDIAAYVDLLRGSPDEAQNLCNDLLIGVTEFFRDRREWELLEREVIPRLFEGKGPGVALRVSVAGCSTGEEAYSLAMLLAERRAALDDPPAIQIFASDLDGRALAVGRAGRFPASTAAHLSPERLRRWFVREGDTYCIAKELREMCIFSQHSLIKEVPFSRLDLVSCRNLLIYLDPELQQKVIRPLRDDRGRVTGFLKIGQDVTEARRVQQALAESDERWRQFGEASSDILWVRDAESLQWEYLSPAFEGIYGLSREEALGGDKLRCWTRLIHPEDRARTLDHIRRVRQGERVTFEFRVIRPDNGEVRWLRDSDFPLLAESGRIVRIGGIGQDVTELKAAEAALAEAEQRHRALLEGIPQLVWRAADGGQWTWSSPQWSAFTGLSPEESLGLGWLEALHPDDRERAVRSWGVAAAAGMLEVEGRIFCAPGQDWRWFQTRATPVRDAGGAVLEWLGTSTDIDDLRALQERQKVLVDELQHRTRNLMIVIRSLADRIGRASTDLADFRARFHDRLEALARVQGLLSRLAGDGRVTFDALVAAELKAMDADERRVTLSGPRGVRLRSSSVQTLAMALHELATNAVKYGALGQPEGRLAVTWSLEPSLGEDRPRLHIDWRESGVAMPQGDAVARVGQGRELIERALPYQLDARTSHVLGPDGVHCTISVPVSALSLQGDHG